MNKFKIVGAALALGALSATANAAMITEAYTGTGNGQFVSRGDDYTFNFNLGAAGSGGDNSSLSLTSDGIGAVGAWSAATLFIDFWDNDSSDEAAWIDVDSRNILDLIIFKIPYVTDVFSDSRWSFSSDGTVRTFQHSFTGSDLAAMAQLGLSWVTIGANDDRNNDFYLRRVALVVNDGTGPVTSVAEPGSLALFGAGLLGLAFVTRRRLLIKK